MNVSYTMGLCMVSSGKATGCLTKHVQTTQSDPGKFITDIVDMFKSVNSRSHSYHIHPENIESISISISIINIS